MYVVLDRDGSIPARELDEAPIALSPRSMDRPWGLLINSRPYISIHREGDRVPRQRSIDRKQHYCDLLEETTSLLYDGCNLGEEITSPSSPARCRELFILSESPVKLIGQLTEIDSG